MQGSRQAHQSAHSYLRWIADTRHLRSCVIDATQERYTS
jgi:hypothetical protein